MDWKAEVTGVDCLSAPLGFVISCHTDGLFGAGASQLRKATRILTFPTSVSKTFISILHLPTVGKREGGIVAAGSTFLVIDSLESLVPVRQYFFDNHVFLSFFLTD